MTSAPAPLPASAGSRLLLVDDNPKLCRMVKEYLEPLGYDVSLSHSGPDGLEKALHGGFHAVILDVMLPGMDGFEVLKRLREKSAVPVLMLTGRGEPHDRIAGLDLGADDYVPKTFSPRELLARLRAVIRRSMATEIQARRAPQPPIEVGPLVVDPGSRSAALGGQALGLTPTEFELLHSLALARGRLKTREELLLEVADRDFESFDRSIDVHISSLRKKLGDDPKKPRFIVTVRAAGYMLQEQPQEARP
jgi:DNA-binding response OmpR family regulator